MTKKLVILVFSIIFMFSLINLVYASAPTYKTGTYWKFRCDERNYYRTDVITDIITYNGIQAYKILSSYEYDTTSPGKTDGFFFISVDNLKFLGLIGPDGEIEYDVNVLDFPLEVGKKWSSLLKLQEFPDRPTETFNVNFEVVDKTFYNYVNYENLPEENEAYKIEFNVSGIKVKSIKYFIGPTDDFPGTSPLDMSLLVEEDDPIPRLIEYGWNKNVCVDSDYGKIYNTFGSACIGSNCKQDTCQNENFVLEYYCGSLVDISNKIEYCAYGCENGACRKTAPSQSSGSQPANTVTNAGSESNCQESDNGKDVYKKGITRCIKGSMTDRCVDKESLEEFYCCSPTDLCGLGYFCPNGCVDGACQPDQYQNKETPIKGYREYYIECSGGSGIKERDDSHCFPMEFFEFITRTNLYANLRENCGSFSVSLLEECTITDLGDYLEVINHIMKQIEQKHALNNTSQQVISLSSRPVICEKECALNGKCYDFGTRIKEKYCSEKGHFMEQGAPGDKCDDGFECLSNSCDTGKCSDLSIIQKITRWIKRMFS